jgi:hypothetical protein
MVAICANPLIGGPETFCEDCVASATVVLQVSLLTSLELSRRAAIGSDLSQRRAGRSLVDERNSKRPSPPGFNRVSADHSPLPVATLNQDIWL